MKKRATEQYKYGALKYSQRATEGGPDFLIFHAPASEIVAWADVDRLGPENRTGAQRPLRKLKVNKVVRFLRSNPKNTIPTSIVVAVDPRAIEFKGQKAASGKGQVGTLTLNVSSGKDKPCLIIDGQHRVFGANAFHPSMNLNIVAFIDNDDSERAFQFVVINNSGSRISKDHIKALNLNFDKEDLNQRLIGSAGFGLGIRDERYDELQVIDESEPFKGLLKWPTNAEGFIPPNAIESALAETHDRSTLLGIQDLELDLFLSIWSTIKKIRKNVWNQNSQLLRKVSIYALTHYMLESMVAKQRNEDEPVDFTDEDTLTGLVTRVISRIPEEFWSSEWKVKELDTSLGRQKLLENLQIIDSNARFRRPWYDNVTFIDPTLLAGQEYDTAGKKRIKRTATKSTATKKASKKAKR